MKREVPWLIVACLLLLLVHAVSMKCDENTKSNQQINDRLSVIEKKINKTKEVDWFLQELESKGKTK